MIAGEAYDKNLTHRAGRGSVRSYMDEALELAGDSELDVARIVTDRIHLDAAVEAYRRFDRREDGCVKVLLLPADWIWWTPRSAQADGGSGCSGRALSRPSALTDFARRIDSQVARIQ